MRLLITLRSEKDCSYDLKYYHKLRGFIYDLQKDSHLNKHANTYSFFSYSNIFPVDDMKTGDLRTLIIASPDREFINYLHGRLSQIQVDEKPVNIGEMRFIIEVIKTLNPYIDSSTQLITGTPIIIRIPSSKYDDYGIESNKPYVYWRPKDNISAFVKQLTDNLAKKYQQYYNREIDDKNVFSNLTFKKDVCVHRVENGKEIQTIGSIWEFRCDHLTSEQRKMVWLGLESGFGELNGSGFGFMNVMNR